MKTSVNSVQLVQRCEVSISLENVEEVRAFINILNEADDYFEKYNPTITKQYQLESKIIGELINQMKKKFSEKE